MRAIIFSAGLGTRLRPLTNNKPKALVLLNGKPLLWHAIEKLKNAGIDSIIVNVHHFSDQVIDYLSKTDFGLPVSISDETSQLLDTGGGILKAKAFLSASDNFLAYNVDVVSTVNLDQLIKEHLCSKALATLVVRERSTSRYLLWDAEKQLSGWTNTSTGEVKEARPSINASKPYAFSGIQVISSRLFQYTEEEGKFSIIDLYLRLAQKHPIKCFVDTSDFWIDLGKPGQIEAAEKILARDQ